MRVRSDIRGENEDERSVFVTTIQGVYVQCEYRFTHFVRPGVWLPEQNKKALLLDFISSKTERGSGPS